MADRMTPSDVVSGAAEADLDAFLRRRDDVRTAPCAGLICALSRLRGSEDPVVTFAGLARACVPEFADGCQVELGDGAEPLFRLTHPESQADALKRAEAHPASPGAILLTPFRVASRTGYPSYAGVVTHWWTDRAPDDADAAIADLMVKHAIALVDRERLMAAVGRAENRAASLALQAICGRAISLATGIVMRQEGLSPDGAENRLRQAASKTGSGLPEVAAAVLRARSLAGPATPRRRPGPALRHLAPADPTTGGLSCG